LVKNQILEQLIDLISASKDFKDAVDAVERGETDPYSASESLALSFLRDN